MFRAAFVLIKLSLGVAVVLASTSSPTKAGTFFLDFDTDPNVVQVGNGVQFGGDAEWRATGGLNDSGYLKVTDANTGERGAILIGDLDDGGLVDGFLISADLRVGGGTDDPADGFSFNFASFDDPAILNLVGAVAAGEQNSPEAVSGYADVGNPGNPDLPEEGTTTGIAIGFDEHFSGNQLTNNAIGIEGGASSDPVDDVIGLSVRVDNIVLEQAELPTPNGASDDITSLQTGPNEDGLTGLDWANLTMSLTPGTHQLQITWKDAVVFDEVIDWAPRSGALLFAGRTGALTAHHHIDNLSVETFLASSGVPCDFDGNGICELNDIDLLMYDGLLTQDDRFDLNGDGLVSSPGDRDTWLRQAGSLPGDANLDGVVNAQDLNAVGSNWQADGLVSWAEGDFDGDGRAGASDLNDIGLQWTKTATDFAFQAGLAPVAAVPEPSSASLALLALLGLIALKTNRGSTD